MILDQVFWAVQFACPDLLMIPTVQQQTRLSTLDGSYETFDAYNSRVWEEQKIGAVLVSPSGDYFLYEWSRPLSTNPLNAEHRWQTLVFKVLFAL